VDHLFGGNMANQNLVRQFRSLSTINKVGISLAGFNAIGLLVALSLLSGVAGIRSEIQGALDDSKRQFNATLAETESRITAAVDQAVLQIGPGGEGQTCTGTYSGSLDLNLPEAPDSFSLSGSILGSSIYGSLRSSSLSGFYGSNSESGSISLSCR
jgi:hypothetical protein